MSTSSASRPPSLPQSSLPQPTLSQWADEQFNTRIGIELLEASPERVVGTLPVAGNRQPGGLLHGGANAALAEHLGSVAAMLYAGQGRVAVGLELSCTHHRPAVDGVVTGVCTPLHLGRSTATYDIVITDSAGRRTCTARLTCVLPSSPITA